MRCTHAFPIIILCLASACADEPGPPGAVAPDQPRQSALQQAPILRQDEFIIRPVASFEVEALVLSTRRYRWGRSARISPVDFALGWGPMSDHKNLEYIDITQSRRYYWWSVDNFPIPRKDIIENSANMHLIPATEGVRDHLLDVRRGDVVGLKGYLVNVMDDDDFYWRSSTSRSDTGSGACELFWVDSVQL